MKLIAMLLLIASCGKDPGTKTVNQLPVINPVEQYFCKDEAVCKDDCDDRKISCYEACNQYRAEPLNLRSCKLICDNNHITCGNQIFQK